MPEIEVTHMFADLLVTLGAGLVSGAICKRLGVSLLVGYLLVGSVVGSGGLNLVRGGSAELELLAEAGALLLLFAVGIEFSLEELLKLLRYLIVGGAVQMLLVSIPLAMVARYYGFSWSGALLAGSAGALSSTVLVFRALSELGQTAAPHGRRAIGILLFQDVALVPLLLLVPLLTGRGNAPTFEAYLLLGIKSALFVLATILIQQVISRWGVPLLADLRSVELTVLFTLVFLGGVCWSAARLGLPAAVGALAAGIVLSGNRLSKQIDTIVLPFRESFAAVFFVTLGMLLEPGRLLQEPVLLAGGWLGIVTLKTLAAAVGMRCVGLGWRSSLAMGLGLSQLGEFSFLLIAEGVREGIIDPADYNRMLIIALGTLICTPQFLRWGLAWIEEEEAGGAESGPGVAAPRGALIVGVGPIGRQVASRLETMGVEVRLLDLSPLNLYPFAQAGFTTFAGDARDPDVLRRAEIEQCELAIVCVPSDDVAAQVVASLRDVSPSLAILVRCRYQSRIPSLEKAGAARVISEEQEASGALVRMCEDIMAASPTISSPSTESGASSHDQSSPDPSADRSRRSGIRPRRR